MSVKKEKSTVELKRYSVRLFPENTVIYFQTAKFTK